MLHAPKTCVHECMRTCKPAPIWPMGLAKPANSLHERMHATRYIYKLLIPIKIGTRNTNLKILCPSRGMCTNTVHSADMLACTCTHGWSRQMAQIISICMRYTVLCQARGPVRHAWAEPCMRVESARIWHFNTCARACHMHAE